MNKMRNLKLMVVLLLATSLILTACGGKESAKSEQSSRDDKYGGTLITADLLSDPGSFNPITSSEHSEIVGIVLESLTDRNAETLEIEPELAKSWEVSEDGLEWTFHLRENVKWHDGEPFSADDVIFTYQVVYDENIPNSSKDGMIIGGEKIEVLKVDDYTVKLILPQPYAPLLSQLDGFVILPKHKLYQTWQEGKFNQSWGIDTKVSEIVGTGPYKFVDYKTGERLVFERNPYYWKKDQEGNQLPYIDRIVRQIAGSRETQVLKFEKGETHLVGIKNSDYNRMKAMEEQKNFTLYDAGPTWFKSLISFNQNPNNPNVKEQPWKYEWFTNIHFRRAAAYAVDRETIINQVYAGFGQPDFNAVSAPNKRFLNPDIRKYPYSLDQARAELKKGGFSWNDQGQLIDRDGRVVEFTFVTNAGNELSEANLNIIANGWKELGMVVHAIPIDFSKLVRQLTSEYTWDAFFLYLTGSPEPNSGSNVWKSSGNLHMWNPKQQEPATQWEARIDELFLKGATTSDYEERKKYYDQWQEIVADQVPVIYTAVADSIYGVSNTLKNVKPNALGGVLWNLEELYLEK
jgi:peptide/nickel transport system substrate-binding protein